MWIALVLCLCLASYGESQLKTPKGKTPARVLSERTLPTGEKEVTVAIEDSFIHNGQRVAYVEEYSCVKTLKSQSGTIKQQMSRCVPFVTFAEAEQEKTVSDYESADSVPSTGKDHSGENYYRRLFYRETKKTAALQRQLENAKESLEKCDFEASIESLHRPSNRKQQRTFSH